MIRTWLSEPQEGWEPLFGETPTVRLDTHPSGDFVAMQVLTWNAVQTERAAVWSVDTKKIIWNPGNATAICWISGGKELVVVRKYFQPDPNRPPVFATPSQAEYGYKIERITWPDGTLVAECGASAPRGWITDLVASPLRSLACFVWEDQHQSGIEFISWGAREVRQEPALGYYSDKSNLIRGPVFSHDGRFVVLTFGCGLWWSDDWEVPSCGGTFTVGWIVVGDTTTATYRESVVQATVPEGWLPEDPQDPLRSEMLSMPEFVARDRFTVVLPTGERRTFLLSQFFEEAG